MKCDLCITNRKNEDLSLTFSTNDYLFATQIFNDLLSNLMRNDYEFDYSMMKSKKIFVAKKGENEITLKFSIRK